MKTLIHCGTLFTGTEETARPDQVAVIENGVFSFVGPAQAAPAAAPGDTVLDHRAHFVMPGLSDLHVHLSYGNAHGQEDIDFYGSMEYRALRALAAAQRMLAAGFTAMMDPATSGHVSPAVRDALFVGMFPGPRITSSGPALTSRIGLYDYFPSWMGVAPESTGVLIRSLPEAIEEIRKQTKDGVDVIKIAMDGIHGDRTRGLYAAFDQDETTAMVREAHRLGRKVVVHVRGSEGAGYAARAGVDILYHASRIDAEGIAAARDMGCSICPSLMLLVNNIEFARPGDPSFGWWPDIQRRELAAATINLKRAYAAGIPFLVGSETGFAVTPYGEWAARELDIMANQLEFGAGAVLRMATSGNRRMLRDGDDHDSIAVGKRADFLVVDGDPLTDIALLQDHDKLLGIWMDGAPANLPKLPAEIPRHTREMAQGMWSQLYTRETVRDYQRQSLKDTGSAPPFEDIYPAAAQ